MPKAAERPGGRETLRSQGLSIATAAENWGCIHRQISAEQRGVEDKLCRVSGCETPSTW